MTGNEPGDVVENRLHFFDNLRTSIVFLVVLLHAGVVYESSGIAASFWIVDDPATNDLVGILNVVFDIFLMPTMFLIAGYFASLSLGKTRPRDFVKAKFRRLMLPWAIGVLVLMPLYKIIFLASRGLSQEHWTSYFHFSNGIFSQSWLWFLPVLFLFNVVYSVLAKLGWLPRKVSLKSSIVVTFLIGFGTSVAMDMFGLRGWTKTPVIDFQNERLLIYFMVFVLGGLCCQQNAFGPKPRSKKLYFVVNAIAWIPINIYVLFLIVPFIKPGSVLIAPIADRLILWFCFYVSLLCLLYVTIETFRLYLDRPGRIWGELNRNSYWTYILHVIVMGGIATALLNTTIPSFWKYLLLTASTIAASNALISLARWLWIRFRREAAPETGRRPFALAK